MVSDDQQPAHKNLKGAGPRGEYFRVGGKGGPGRKPGMRANFANSFLRAIQEDFDQHGIEVIQRARENHPIEYLKVCASIVPKAMVIQSQVTDARKSITEYSTAELVALIVEGGSETGSGQTIEGESVSVGVH